MAPRRGFRQTTIPPTRPRSLSTGPSQTGSRSSPMASPPARQQATDGRPGPGICRSDGNLPGHGIHRRTRHPRLQGEGSPLLGCHRPGPVRATGPAAADPADRWAGPAVLAGNVAGGVRVVQAADTGHRGPTGRSDAIVRHVPRHRARLGLPVRRVADGRRRGLDHARRTDGIHHSGRRSVPGCRL